MRMEGLCSGGHEREWRWERWGMSLVVMLRRGMGRRKSRWRSRMIFGVGGLSVRVQRMEVSE